MQGPEDCPSHQSPQLTVVPLHWWDSSGGGGRTVRQAWEINSESTCFVFSALPTTFQKGPFVLLTSRKWSNQPTIQKSDNNTKAKRISGCFGMQHIMQKRNEDTRMKTIKMRPTWLIRKLVSIREQNAKLGLQPHMCPKNWFPLIESFGFQLSVLVFPFPLIIQKALKVLVFMKLERKVSFSWKERRSKEFHTGASQRVVSTAQNRKNILHCEKIRKGNKKKQQRTLSVQGKKDKRQTKAAKKVQTHQIRQLTYPSERPEFVELLKI